MNRKLVILAAVMLAMTGVSAAMSVEENLNAYEGLLNNMVSMNTEYNLHVLNNLMDGYSIYGIIPSPVTGQEQIQGIALSDDGRYLVGYFCVTRSGVAGGVCPYADSAYVGTLSDYSSLSRLKQGDIIGAIGAAIRLSTMRYN